MTLRVREQMNNQGERELVINLSNEHIAQFTTILNRALNCTWEDARPEWGQLSDMLVHGKVMPSDWARKERETKARDEKAAAKLNSAG